MRLLLTALAVLCVLIVLPASAAEFRAVNVYLDAPAPLAAWQFELTSSSGMQVVGIEQGDSPVFDDAPYYDREVLRLGQTDRVIVADYSLDDPVSLPTGRVRIATVHLMLEDGGFDDLALTLVTATNEEGRVIDASIGLEDSPGENDD